MHAPQKCHQTIAELPLQRLAAEPIAWRVLTHDLGELRTDREHRVEGQVGILGDETDPPAANLVVEAGLIHRQKIAALEMDRASVDASAAGQNPQDGADQGRLAATGFTDHAQHACRG